MNEVQEPEAQKSGKNNELDVRTNGRNNGPIIKRQNGQCNRHALVPVSALCAFVEDETEAYHRYVEGIGLVPSPPIIYGILEHKGRELSYPLLKQIYGNAETPDTLTLAYDAIQKAVFDAYTYCDRKYGSLDINIDDMQGEILNRLRIEEDVRMVRATNYMMDGVRGFDLALKVLPQATEFELYSPRMGIVGRVDAVEWVGRTPYPVEFKTGRYSCSTVRPSHEIQVAAYAMLLEEFYGQPCNYGELYYTRYMQRVPLLITPELKVRVREAVEGFIAMCSGLDLQGNVEVL